MRIIPRASCIHLLTDCFSSGAACEAAKEGIPAIAFSGQSTRQVSYTTLQSDPDSLATIAALVNSQLTVDFVDALLDGEGTIVPEDTIININTSDVTDCTDPDDFDFIFTRNLADPTATDVFTCGTNQLPVEADVIGLDGCYATVSVISAITKTDVDAETQQVVFDRVESILSCL